MISIESKLILVTGLHIGDTKDSLNIGGVDSPVMKREVFCNDNGEVKFGGKRKVTEPYIAGSSLKGKIRSLLEYNFELIRVAEFLNKKKYKSKDNNKEEEYKAGSVIDSKFLQVLNYKDNYNMNNKELIIKRAKLIMLLFGESGANKETSGINITRAIFRDCFITSEVRKAYLNNNIELFEAKYENVIDRITGTTVTGGLRQIERVPSAVEFDFSVNIRIFEGDNEQLLKDTILLGLKLLELDALGGNGSRGYGRVRFENINEDIKKLKERIDNELNKS
jgi:CRISPR-associated protein Csm3